MADQPPPQRRHPAAALFSEQAPSADTPLELDALSGPGVDHGSDADSVTSASEGDPGIATVRAPIARFYDVAVGGKEGIASTREAFGNVAALLPKLGEAARANADFVPRAVAAAAEAEISQFLDLGCGFPHPDGKTVFNIARQHQLDARVVYVDRDPMVACHGRALLERPGSAWCVEADARDVPQVLREASKHLDFVQPTAIIMSALVHFWADHEDPYCVVDAYLNAFRSGVLIFTHACADLMSPRKRARALNAYARIAPLYPRSEAEIRAFFDGLAVVKPGLVEASTWRPDNPIPVDVGEASFLAAVAEFGPALAKGR